MPLPDHLPYWFMPWRAKKGSQMKGKIPCGVPTSSIPKFYTSEETKRNSFKGQASGALAHELNATENSWKEVASSWSEGVPCTFIANWQGVLREKLKGLHGAAMRGWGQLGEIRAFGLKMQWMGNSFFHYSWRVSFLESLLPCSFVIISEAGQGSHHESTQLSCMPQRFLGAKCPVLGGALLVQSNCARCNFEFNPQFLFRILPNSWLIPWSTASGVSLYATFIWSSRLLPKSRLCPWFCVPSHLVLFYRAWLWNLCLNLLFQFLGPISRIS